MTTLTDIDASQGSFYGPRGWTAHLGLWPILLDLYDTGRDLTQGQGVDLDNTGPSSDYVPFCEMNSKEAQTLLEVLPEDALEDRQNCAPSLRAMLQACVQGSGSVRLSGYGIGPQRYDERISVEALWVADEDLADLWISPTHAEGCQCRQLWDTVSSRYHLDAQGEPDELRRTQDPTGQAGWWLWWD